VLPAVASAEPTPPYGNNTTYPYNNQYNNGQLSTQQREFFRVVRTVNLSSDQRAHIRALERSNNGDERQVRRQVFEMLNPDQRRQLAYELRNDQRFNGEFRNSGGYNNGGYNGAYNNGSGYNNGTYNGGWNGRRRGGIGNGGANNGGYNNANTLNTIVSSFNRFDLYAQNGVHVILHQGTIINPTGHTIQAGERVTVYGHQNGDGTFSADRIDVGQRY
ncbi:MAG: hypothetical protein GIW95_06825, partial [Candidatus Eremiobacteraeota bacterium]|nr:hypothetical protein [Candidatus Eremiobacteraeota bacterium]